MSMTIHHDDVTLIEAGRQLRGIKAKFPHRSSAASTPSSASFVVTEEVVAVVRRRYQLSLHNGTACAETVFDPNSDLGKLIMWGERTPSYMIISPLYLQLIKQTREARGFRSNLRIRSHTSASQSTLPVPHVTGKVDFASQLSGYQTVNRYASIVRDIELAVEAFQDAETDEVERKYLKIERKKMRQPVISTARPRVFNPITNLGKLILAGRMGLSANMVIPDEHAESLRDRLAELEDRRLKLRRLLERARDLEASVPAENRVSWPDPWLQLCCAPRCEPPVAVAASNDPQPSYDEFNDPREEAELETDSVELGAVTVDVPLPQDDKRDAPDYELERDASQSAPEKCESTSTPNDCSELTDQQRVQRELEHMQELYDMWIAD